ncbi:helix-turn-helix domain-containing protein [Microbulbifer rhizosphaerae]|uniref:AraC-like DNA-binding protein n=1 Tax=Microbulbifer rhizosphaerae TaxID=1562603 RepID=A0A7W4WAF6_9GAMM|nr:helix-turn-helix domain-containing protein [Microbulbifer rhizosphaerae]MBB3060645.1 AraC-like DNA-binding protein [Microbulbifer rhizosphaerae]
MNDHSGRPHPGTNEASGIKSGFIKPSYSFETSQLPLNEQFDGYRDELPGHIERSDGKGISEKFFVDTKGFSLGDIRAVSSRSDGFSFYRSPQDVKSFDMDDWVVAVRTKGHVDANVDGNAVRFQGSHLELRNTGEPFSAHLSAHESLYFFLPRKTLTGLEGILDHISVSEKSKRLHPLLGHYLMALGARLSYMTPSESLIAAETTRAMIRASVARSPESIAAAQTPILATQFEVARKFIERNLGRPDLTVESVRAALCVSRRQVYKIFENLGGVERYIRSRRLSACLRELQSSEMRWTISQIAERYGFKDVAGFSRQFRAQFGGSPGELREAAGSMPKRSNYTEWLNRQ